MKKAAVVAIMVCGTMSALADTWYVATNSPADGPGTAWSNAFHTIQAAVDVAASDDTVLVTNGVYFLSSGVNIDTNLTVKSVNGATYTIVDGGGNDRCFELGDHNILLEGFTVTNGYCGGYGGGIECWGTRPVISNCYIVGNANYNFYDGGGVYHGTLYNCVIRNNHSADDGGGISYSFAYNCLISGNSCGYNGGGADGSTLYNCTIVDNRATNNGGGVCNGVLSNCVVWGNTATTGTNWLGGSMSYCCTTPDPGAGSGNITNDPQFMNAANGNYRLRYGSSCIDTGTNLPIITNDLDGVARPLDGNYDGTNTTDMGCYEYDPATADSNGDGVPDWWYHGYALNPTNPTMAATDSDGDGMDDGSEYTADTVPTDSNSYFRVTDIEKNSPVSLYFTSSSNRLYSLQGCSTLITGDWLRITGKTGAGGVDFMQDTNEPPQGPYYRLEVELP